MKIKLKNNSNQERKESTMTITFRDQSGTVVMVIEQKIPKMEANGKNIIYTTIGEVPTTDIIDSYEITEIK